MSVRLISVTPDAENQMAYCARVSNPNNQENPDYARLLKYCINHKHWSIFEMASMTVQIDTTRAIAAQILRHRSFTFQEFSQRYADAGELGEIEVPHIRSQDTKNRQNSNDDIEGWKQDVWSTLIADHFKQAKWLYNKMLEQGVAKESARFILPLATPTRMYMTGSVRSWLHYIALREKSGTQKEHKDIANEVKILFCQEFPTVADALGGVDIDWEI